MKVDCSAIMIKCNAIIILEWLKEMRNRGAVIAIKIRSNISCDCKFVVGVVVKFKSEARFIDSMIISLNKVVRMPPEIACWVKADFKSSAKGTEMSTNVPIA